MKNGNKLSEFLRGSLMIFIIKGFRTIVFIFLVISTTFQAICPPAFFWCLSNSGTYMNFELHPLLSNNTGIFNTCTRLWLMESEQVTLMDSIKDVVQSSV